ncbi:MAG: class I SAM-dependent methyltransferase [Rhodospirillaceae bacterium]|nr:class I SAM-dependent methyltransferase [Rhodospirillaceae bacterium]MBT4487805.1 class I SAM-dependent methyltransferase [Rhodospirillaceae bacterium]MBT5192587.1 class I SAM-dependent methyltransferase [Rhodospirillaceae bacterium]MBT5898593.1 class I SAM-dependent methyltransferase [Rhodospirillaceae bacterium]MBT6429128.1 class I SAM-dependent methyltransferase [Rhodospirillaceae bacterium]
MQHMQDPSPWIERFADLIPTGGAVLDLACGGGRHAHFLLQRGHSVTAIDRDVTALTPHENLEIIEHDLEDGSPWPLGARIFAAVVVVNYLHRPLLPQLVAAVAPSGLLLYDTFAIGNETFGRPSNPDFLLRRGELAEAARGKLEIIECFHGRIEIPNPAVKQQICARR